MQLQEAGQLNSLSVAELREKIEGVEDAKPSFLTFTEQQIEELKRRTVLVLPGHTKEQRQ